MGPRRTALGHQPINHTLEPLTIGHMALSTRSQLSPWPLSFSLIAPSPSPPATYAVALNPQSSALSPLVSALALRPQPLAFRA